jgi:hypothetical protein
MRELINSVFHHTLLELAGQGDDKGGVCSAYGMAFGRKTLGMGTLRRHSMILYGNIKTDLR